MTRIPASIRHNNPGAMWPGPSSKKFGATGHEVIGGGNQIATFDDPVKGAAAQFDLLRRSYAGMTLADAINKWSGGNSPTSYAQRISSATGIPMNAVLTPQMLSDEKVAISLAKTAADWEAGGRYPMSDEQWAAAFRMAGTGAQPQQAPPASIVEPEHARIANVPSHEPSLENVGSRLANETAPAGSLFPFGFGFGGGAQDNQQLAQQAMTAVSQDDIAMPASGSVRKPISRLNVARAIRKLGFMEI